jgi:hypothetical protein
MQSAVVDFNQKFIEAWILNWDWDLDMLREVEKRLGDDFVCVRSDVLVKLKQNS